jgi:drug/metabolite transporter (DMT)-like permease
VSRRSWLLLGVLSALWGSSYLFIKVALEDDLSPTAIVCVRAALAALLLLPLAARAGALGGLRANRRAILVLAVIQMGGPLLLIAAGERHIASSLTGILVAAAPIFTFLLAFALEGEERASGASLGGVAIGIAGVAMLLGVDVEGGFEAVAGGLMVVLAAFGYGVSAWYVKRHVHDVQPVAMVGATAATVSVLMLPFAAISAPSHLPELKAVGSLLALGFLCTGLAFVIFYSLVASDGPAKASLVGYLAPGFSILYGVTLLDERVTVFTFIGLILITAGSWLAATGGQLPARGVDVATASEADCAPDSALLEGGAERVDRVTA